MKSATAAAKNSTAPMVASAATHPILLSSNQSLSFRPQPSYNWPKCSKLMNDSQVAQF